MLTRAGKEAKKTPTVSGQSAKAGKPGKPASAGQPLEPATMTFMESRLGHDFSRVRVHTGPEAAESARAVSALAYTVGEHVVFGRGGFSPDTVEGRKLLGHELAHVVQQRQGGAPASGRATEAEADRIGEAMAAGRAAQVSLAAAPGTMQRKPDADEQKVLAASKAAALDPQNTGKLMARGIDMIHFIMKKHFSFMLLSLGKYQLDENLKDGIVAERFSTDNGTSETLNLRFGPDFVLGVTEDRLPEVVAKVEKALQGVDGAQGKEFDKELREGAILLRQSGFGTTSGGRVGQDVRDAYDASFWKESGVSIETTGEPWLAVKKLFEKLGQPIPKAGGGVTKWSFDCFQATQVIRLYAYLKTLSRFQFNQRFPILKIGASAERTQVNPDNPDYGWGETVLATGPKDRPYIWADAPPPKASATTISFDDKVQKRLGKSWKQILKAAPVGSRVTWTNLDAKEQCDAAAAANQPNPSFINFIHENTTKLGDDQYHAYPFQEFLTQKQIETKMAEAVLGEGKATQAYIDKNIFVSTLTYPRDRQPKL